MMERDKRLTGHLRGQKVRFFSSFQFFGIGLLGNVTNMQSDPTPPAGFETSSIWSTKAAREFSED